MAVPAAKRRKGSRWTTRDTYRPGVHLSTQRRHPPLVLRLEAVKISLGPTKANPGKPGDAKLRAYGFRGSGVQAFRCSGKPIPNA